jgi:hypothetical protein
MYDAAMQKVGISVKLKGYMSCCLQILELRDKIKKKRNNLA